MPYKIDRKCTKCGACLPECPTGSIIEGSEQFYIDADTCGDHAACVAVCPVNAISIKPLAVTPAAQAASAPQKGSRR